MNTEEKIISSETLYAGKVFTAKKYTVALPDGRTAYREEVEHHGGAGILAEEGGKVYLVKQFRLSVGKEILEIPAGKLEKGEDPLVCAKRELSEETGLTAKKWTEICSASPSPGYTNEIIHIYRAEGFSFGKTHFDDDEFLNVVKIPVENAFEMIESGEIFDAKTVIALLYLKTIYKQS